MTYAWGPETGFFYENTSFVLEDEVKNPVSLSKCVQDSEYKFNRRPINFRETARRCIQISGNGSNQPDWMVQLPSRVRSTPTIHNNAKENTAIPIGVNLSF